MLTVASSINKLSAAFVRNAAPGRHNDGGGLYLLVTPAGDGVNRAWLFRFKQNGAKWPREMGLGSVNTYSLGEARERAKQCRQLLDRGIDPIEHRKAELATAKAEAAKAMTFEQAVAAFIADKRNGWREGRNGGHASEFASTLRNHAADLSKLPVAAIETAHVVSCLRKIWTDKNETATRVRGRIEMVLDWAKAGGFRNGSENPARWKGHLENVFTKRTPRSKRVSHHAALPYAELPAFMHKLEVAEGIAARAIEMLILTATRLGELRAAEWGEIDLTAAVWTIPAAKTKSHTEHRVPLAPRVVAMLRKLPRDAASPYVFSGITSARKPLDPVAIRKTLHDIHNDGITLHGFRSCFKDWVSDCTDYPRELAEEALNHVVGNKVERAYRRGDALDKRRHLMKDWAAFCGDAASRK
jgi:integrase